jgi:hypothetical protein
MHGLAIRLGVVLVALAVVSQLALPPYLEHRAAKRLTEHGGSAQVSMSALPAVRLLFGHGRSLKIRANGLAVDLQENQSDVFEQLDRFGRVDVDVAESRAGPFTVHSFRLKRIGPHTYDVRVSAEAAAGDVARYAGSQLAGSFGQALAGLATTAIGGFARPVPVDARMQLDTTTRPPRARDVEGEVAGLPAGPLGGIVTNILLSAL